LWGNPLSIFPAIAYIAFPILPYELFIFMPVPFAYFAENPHPKITVARLITFITYWGAGYGGLVHYVALFSVLSGLPKIDAHHGICTALPPVSKAPWCALLTWHVLLAVPMGTCFLYLVYKDKKMYGWFQWSGPDEKKVLYSRCALYFIVLGFSGDLPYFGELAEQGGNVFDGTGVYAGTTWANWYHGRGVLEFLSYLSWLLSGIYFLVRAIMVKSDDDTSINEAGPEALEAVEPVVIGAKNAKEAE